MAAIQIETPPAAEPVTLAEAKDHCRVTFADDDSLITSYIQAARETVEAFLGRSLVSKGYRQSLDSFPYYTDTMLSQMAYPPSYYSLPRYSTTLWNYSQMIKLFRAPLVNVPQLSYLSSGDSKWHNLIGANVSTWDPAQPGDFLFDADSEPPRLFPLPGQYWPSVLYVPNAVQIHYTAGYGADGSKVPEMAKLAIKHIVGHWYENREGISPDPLKEVPFNAENLLWRLRIVDFAPTRG
jgi:hypothetical protein